MRFSQTAAALLAALSTICVALAQPTQGKSAREALEDRFQAFRLKVGDHFPEVDIHDAEGKRFNTRSLKGKYTVIVNGCLT
ncbi:MAG: hypothetical protein HY238_00580 [Acidobacteria bacterium]|nr:hypothetical protein [Acidobacteriota bacterium]